MDGQAKLLGLYEAEGGEGAVCPVDHYSSITFVEPRPLIDGEVEQPGR